MNHRERTTIWQCTIALALWAGGWSTCQPCEGGDVEILRDRWGIPHIFASSEIDGFYGLGYAGAEDRVLQMELLRRRASGRLAEVFGPDWVDSDRAARIAGHVGSSHRAFESLPPRWQEALRAYAAGVNAFVSAQRANVDRRFAPLGIAPEPWTPVDSLLVARGLLELGSPFQEGPIEAYHAFAQQAKLFGEEEARRRATIFVDDSVAIVSEAQMAKDRRVYEELKRLPRMPGFGFAVASDEPRKMSHAWAVAGSRSKTGKPILENDPQLPLCSPPFFHEFHLCVGDIDARGIGIPGAPGLFVGFNRQIAWGGSALGVDSTVIFLDRLDEKGSAYLWMDQAIPFDRRLEHIEVKGSPAVVQEVLTNRHGTVFNSLSRRRRPGDVHVCHDALTIQGRTNIQAMLEVLTARDWDQFRKAMEHYFHPGLHVVYADTQGHVGYHTVVHRPLTAKSPRTALEGWTGRDEITARIPFEHLPHLLDPDAGFVSHANNLPVGSWYPYDLGLSTGGTGDTSRSLRLRQLLEGDRTFSAQDFEEKVHRDDVNPTVALLLPVARKVVQEDKIDDPAVLDLLKSLEGWDLRAGSADRFPSARSIENALTPYRGAGLQNRFGAAGGGIAHLARVVGNAFAKDGTTPSDPRIRQYLVNWLRWSLDARSTARRGQPSDAPSTVSERQIVIPYQRTIPVRLPVIDSALDIVSPTLTCLDTGTIWSQPGNLYTQIVDLANVDASRTLIAPGNSEDPQSPYRTNQIETWVKGATHEAPLTRSQIEKGPVTRVVLTTSAYTGPVGPEGRTVAKVPSSSRLIQAIPPVDANAVAAAPLPGRKPDDPTLEAGFRYLLRGERSADEIRERLSRMKEYAQSSVDLTKQFREGLVLVNHLMTESRAGRLRIRYGTPEAMSQCAAALEELTAKP